MLFQKQANYQTYRLDEVCSITRGKRAKGVENGKYKAFGAGSKETKRTDEANAPAGSIRLTCKGTVGEVYIHTEDFWAEEACLTIRPKEGLKKAYLFHWLKKNSDIIKHLKTGSIIPGLDQERFCALPFELPDMAYQDEVCMFLEKLELEIQSLITQSHLNQSRLKYQKEKLVEQMKERKNGI